MSSVKKRWSRTWKTGTLCLTSFSHNTHPMGLYIFLLNTLFPRGGKNNTECLKCTFFPLSSFACLPYGIQKWTEKWKDIRIKGETSLLSRFSKNQDDKRERKSDRLICQSLHFGFSFLCKRDDLRLHDVQCKVTNRIRSQTDIYLLT